MGRGRPKQGTVLERMFQYARMNESSEVLDLSCVFIEECGESNDEYLEMILDGSFLRVWGLGVRVYIPEGSVFPEGLFSKTRATQKPYF